MNQELAKSADSVKAADLPGQIAQTYHSDWLTIDQARIDAFADATLDDQWIHVDVERANRETGGTIAHGFLILSLFTRLVASALTVTHYRQALNYGFDKLRFTAPVKAGSRVRMRMVIAAVDPRGDGLQLRRQCTLEIEGSDRPAIVANWLTLFYPE